MLDPEIDKRIIYGYRAWFGFYTMMSKNIDVRLSERNLFPIIRTPGIESVGQKRIIIYNVKNFLNKIPAELFPLALATYGIRSLGQIPYPLGEVSDTEVKQMSQNMKDSISVIEDIKSEMASLEKIIPTYEEIFEMILNGDVSIIAAAIYASRKKLEHFDIADISIVIEDYKNIFDLAVKLETDYKFFTKSYSLTKRNIIVTD